jgi:hypothetical protein
MEGMSVAAIVLTWLDPLRKIPVWFRYEMRISAAISQAIAMPDEWIFLKILLT